MSTSEEGRKVHNEPNSAAATAESEALRQLRDDVEDLPEVARGGLHRSNIGALPPRTIVDQCCCELLDLRGMVSMVENCIEASRNLPVEMDGTKETLSYVRHQLIHVFKLVNSCLPFIQNPEVPS